MGEVAPTPHVVLVSFPAQGHVNPLLRLANRLASKGLLVTFSTSLFFGSRILSSSDAAADDDSLIPVGRGHLRFDFFSDGWADDDPRRADLDALMTQLRTHAASEFRNLIVSMPANLQPVTCVINNPFVPWALDIAEELDIRSAVLWVQSCSVFSTYYHYVHEHDSYFAGLLAGGGEHGSVVKLPGIPELTVDELPTFLLPTNPYKPLTQVILSQFHNLEKASWVFANSFDELEHEAILGLPRPIIPVGPLVDIKAPVTMIKGDMWKSSDECLEWLEEQRKSSVVYVSLGSVVVLSEGEMEEMARGLMGCGRPFIWVVREDSRSLLPSEFLAAGSKEQGLVVAWAPQERVLEHEAVGCFVTHCGWNSTLEALTAAVPVVAYPQWGDQVPDAKFLVDVYGVGVRMKAPVTREEVWRCVREVVDEGEGIRARARDWGEKARRAVGPGGSSDKNLDEFVADLVGMGGAG